MSHDENCGCQNCLFARAHATLTEQETHEFEESCNCPDCCEVRGGNLAGREADLANALCHVFGAVHGDSRDWHLQWARYHLGRATQGMPEKVANDLHELMDQFEGEVGK